MFAKHRAFQVFLLLMVMFILLMPFLGQKAMGAPQVTLRVIPVDREVHVGGEAALRAEARGVGLRFNWDLDGPGQLEGSLTGIAVKYKAPATLKDQIATATVKVIITDAHGQQVKEQVTFQLISKVEKTGQSQKKPSIIMTDFKSNSYINGRVVGLDPKEYKNHKVLVYVLTNQWYIHPYAAPTGGIGFANIQKDGTWRIKTVRREFQAFRVAFLLVERSVFPLATVKYESDPDQDLVSSIPTVTHIIIPAPSGI